MKKVLAPGIAAPYLYANGELADGATYVAANVYQYRGAPAGTLEIGDLEGKNVLIGSKIEHFRFFSPTQVQIEGEGSCNGTSCHFTVQFNADTDLTWSALDSAGNALYAGTSAYEVGRNGMYMASTPGEYLVN